MAQAKSTTKSTGNGGSTANKTATSSAKRSPTADSFSNKAHEVVTKLTEQLASAEEKLRETASTTKVEAKQKAGEAQVKKDELLRDASAYIKEKPLYALGIAALGGALLGMFLKRR